MLIIWIGREGGGVSIYLSQSKIQRCDEEKEIALLLHPRS